MKTPTTKLMFAAVAAAIGLTAMAETTNTVKVTKFHQSYPYSGWATVEYTVGGALPANAMADITLSTDDKSATFRQRGVVEGANTNEIEFASSFGGALVLTNASFVLTVANAGMGTIQPPTIQYDEPSAVQLWEGGPYWAEWNLGATNSFEYGCYFWWGDPVGYKYDGSFVSADGSTKDFTFSSSEISRLPWGENIGTGADPVKSQLGSDWRMPTESEFGELSTSCTMKFAITNDVPWRPQVNGILVTGKGDYADRSIFLPAGDRASGASLAGALPSWDGAYWISTSVHRSDAYKFHELTHGIEHDAPRWEGYFIRPVRDSAE